MLVKAMGSAQNGQVVRKKVIPAARCAGALINSPGVEIPVVRTACGARINGHFREPQPLVLLGVMTDVEVDVLVTGVLLYERQDQHQKGKGTAFIRRHVDSSRPIAYARGK